MNFPITLTASDVDSLGADLHRAGRRRRPRHAVLPRPGVHLLRRPPNYNGPDSFTFTVTDGSLERRRARSRSTSTAVNDAPVATDVPDAETDEDIAGRHHDHRHRHRRRRHRHRRPHHRPAARLGAHHLGPTLTTYLGDLNFNGIDTFDFTVTDGNGGFDDGTVAVTVHPVNDAPVVNDQTFHVNEDTAGAAQHRRQRRRRRRAPLEHRHAAGDGTVVRHRPGRRLLAQRQLQRHRHASWCRSTTGTPRLDRHRRHHGASSTRSTTSRWPTPARSRPTRTRRWTSLSTPATSTAIRSTITAPVTGPFNGTAELRGCAVHVHARPPTSTARTCSRSRSTTATAAPTAPASRSPSTR